MGISPFSKSPAVSPSLNKTGGEASGGSGRGGEFERGGN